MKKCLGLLYATCVLGSAVCHAASFQNLNFDSANTNNVVPIGIDGRVGPTSELLPNWQLTVTGTAITPIGFNLTAPGSGYATIISPTYINNYPVVGAYSFAMHPKYDVQGTFVPYSLAQTGDLPADTKSIHFLNYGAPVQLGVNGSLVPVAYMQRLSQPGWNGLIPVFDAVADMSPYAGQTVELKFTTLRTPNYQGLNGLDEIFFSDIAIPEPDTLAVLILGGAFLCARLRRR